MSILRLGPSANFVAAAGVQSPVVPTIQSINRLFVDTTAGAATFQNLSTGLDGQLLWIFNQGPSVLTLQNQSGVPGTGSVFDGVGDIAIEANDSLMIFYDLSLDFWIIGV